MNGWILLHKKIWDSPNFKYQRNRSNIFVVWFWLLCHCSDKGVVTCGRDQIAKATGIHPSSVKRVLEYIRDHMPEVTYKATKVYTEITICNWEKYQRKATNEVTHKRPISDLQVTTNKEERIKKKEVKNNTIQIADGNLVNDIIKLFGSLNPSYETLFKRKNQRDAAERLSLKFTVAQIKQLVDAAVAANGQAFAPVITTPCQLEDKLGALKAFYDKTKTKSRKVGMV